MTLAEHRLQMLVRDRAEEIDGLLNTMRAHGGGFIKKADRIASDHEGYRQFVDAGGVGPGVWQHLIRDKLDLSNSVRDPAQLLVADLDQEGVSATCGIEDDESGLVLIADGLHALIVYMSSLAMYCGLDFSSARRVYISQLGMSKRQAESAALLRYVVLQERLQGRSSKPTLNLGRAATRLNELYVQVATTFVVAHEVGHFVLGHPNASFATTQGVELPTVASDQQLETVADMFAYETVHRVLAAHVPDRKREDVVQKGVGIALLAVDMYEHGTFIRGAHSHPAAGERWLSILEAGRQTRSSPAITSLSALRRPYEAALDFDIPLDEDCWRQVNRSKKLLITDSVASDLRNMRGVDRLMALSLLDTNLHLLATFAPCCEGLAARARSQELNAEDELRELGLQAKYVAELLDPHATLTYHGLIRRLGSAEAFADVEGNSKRTAAAAVAAQVLRPALADIASKAW